MNDIPEDKDFLEEGEPATETPAADAPDSEEAEGHIDIEIEDDTPEEDRGRPRRKGEPQVPSDDEIAAYSEGVQKRIKALRYEFHEERRRKEEAERIRDEAINYAQTVFQENQRLLEQSRQANTVLADTAKGRIEAELERARAAYREAFDSGDSQAALAAQENITRLLGESQRYEALKAQPPQQQQARRPPQAIPEPDARAKAWARENPWFEKDPVMTAAAYGVHQKLYNEGIAPGSERYWKELDAEMREAFPHRFQSGEPEQRDNAAGGKRTARGPVVAPASRGGKTTRSVTLTASAAALIKRLGITPEQYIAQMMKDAKNG